MDLDESGTHDGPPNPTPASARGSPWWMHNGQIAMLNDTPENDRMYLKRDQFQKERIVFQPSIFQAFYPSASFRGQWF